MRVALVHDWLTGMRGGEWVLYDIARLFPESPIYTVVHRTGSVAPLLELRREHGRPWSRRVQSLAAQGLQQLFGSDRRWRRLAVLTGLVVLAVVAVGEQPYRISAPATVEGAVQQAVVAPFDGFITSAGFRAGQTVGEGDLLARLDDRELKTEQRRLQADEGELLKQHRQAVATLDHGETKVGRLTSGGYSLAFGKSIGMGYVTPDLATPGTRLKVLIQRKLWDAVITEDSPYDPKNERIRADG